VTKFVMPIILREDKMLLWPMRQKDKFPAPSFITSLYEIHL